MKGRADKMKRIISFLPGCKGSNNNRDNSRGGGIISLAGGDFLDFWAFRGPFWGKSAGNAADTVAATCDNLLLFSSLLFSFLSFFYIFIFSLYKRKRNKKNKNRWGKSGKGGI